MGVNKAAIVCLAFQLLVFGLEMGGHLQEKLHPREESPNPFRNVNPGSGVENVNKEDYLGMSCIILKLRLFAFPQSQIKGMHNDWLLKV